MYIDHTPVALGGNTNSASWLEFPVSCFSTVTRTSEAQQMSVGQILQLIRSDPTLGKKIKAARQILAKQGKASYQKWRLNNLQAFAISGVGCREKGASTISLHSGLLQIDIDADSGQAAAIEELRPKLQKDPHMAFLFGSPSGYGLKGAMRIDGTRHEESFLAATEYLRNTYGVEIDQSVKDPMRLCFFSSDPDLFINEEAVELPIPVGFRLVTQDHPEDTGRPKNTHDGREGEKEALFALFEAAERCACPKRDTANPRSFQLAREVKGVEYRLKRPLSLSEIEPVFDCWHRLSLPNLEPGKDRSYYYYKFMDRLDRVRVPVGAGDRLELARLRASVLPLPKLEGLDEKRDLPLLRILALHRELQRLAAEASYFLSARDAQAFAGLNHPMEAQRIQTLLKSSRVNALRLIRAGEQRPGGHATEWRYLLEIPPLPSDMEP